MSQRAFPVMLLIALGIVFYQQTRLGNFPPPPSAFVGVAIVFSLLAVLALLSPQLATAFAVAIVIWLALAYQGGLVRPISSPSPQGATAR